jgi:NAD(P)-dependent dehydrogenase (short-subunit alcohol dehydrogenase family)
MRRGTNLDDGLEREGSAGKADSPSGLLDGRVAVVTAGAGAIGDAICTLFAEQGADVVVADIDRPRVRETVARVRKLGQRALPVVADLTKPRGVARLRSAALDGFGRVDVLVNGLGHHLGAAGSFARQTEAQWQALYEVNLQHVFRVTYAFLPGMTERGWGRIVNISSVEGIRSHPSNPVYAAFKHGVEAFTKSLAVDVARDGVLVNCIAVDKTRAYQVEHYALPEEYARLAPVWIPAGHYGEPREVARVALFLGSEMNSWVVGHTVPADGGTLAAGGWFRTPKRWTNQPLLVQYFEDPEVNERRPPRVQ